MRVAAFALCLLPILAGTAGLLVQAPVDVSRPAAWLAIALGGGGWLAALALAGRVPDLPGLGLVLVGGALALRGIALAQDPGLSDDGARYVWEGALVAEGVSPYAAAPASPARAAERARWPRLAAAVNHPEVPAAYPPLTQVLHAGVVRLAGGPEPPARALLGLRLFYGVADLLACLPLAALLRARGLARARLVAWAWNPWVALECAGQGHLDALAVLVVLLALAAATGRAARTRLGLALLGVGTALKLLPAVLVPFLARRLRRPWSGLVLALGAALLACLPFVAWTGALPRAGGLAEYAFRWESFSLAYRPLEPLLARAFAYDESWTDPRRLGRALVALAGLGVALRAWRRRLEPAQAAAVVLGALLVLTPTLHPWYLCWIVPFLALRPRWSWCALAAVAPLLYWPLAGWRMQGIWREPGWLWPVLAGTFFGLALLEHLRHRRLRPA